MGNLLVMALAVVRENPDAIRAVNRQSEEYLGIVESIRLKGFNGVVVVREVAGTDEYVIVDGMHRYCAAKDAGLTEIPVTVVTMSEAEAIEYSIMANVHNKQTTATEYCNGCLKLLALNPMLTEAELATKLGKSPTWLSNILRLNKIEDENILGLINEGKINLSNAYAMAKLPPEEMADFITDAQALPPEEFIPAVNARIKAIRDAKRKGDDAAGPEFSPAEFLQKMKDIKEQRDSGEIAQLLVAETGIDSAEDGFTLALNWCLHADVFSVTEQQAAWDEKQALKAEKDKQKATERAAKQKAKKEAELKEAIENEAKIKEEAAV